MKGKRSSILGICLMLCLVLSMLTIQTFAAEEEMEAAEQAEEVTLTSKETVSVPVVNAFEDFYRI